MRVLSVGDCHMSALGAILISTCYSGGGYDREHQMKQSMIIALVGLSGASIGLLMGFKLGFKRGDTQGSRRGFARGIAVTRDVVQRITNATR